MVYILDEGSVFDAPIGKIWEYLSSQSHNHPSMKVISREMKGQTVEITTERDFGGKKARMKIRNTLFPPFGMVQEYLEGPLAGSRACAFYIPKGQRTGITVVGDFKMEGANDEETRKALMASLETIFNEDNTNLKNTK